MSAAIQIESVSKMYKIGHTNPTLREHIMNAVITLKFLQKKQEEEVRSGR